MEFCIPMSVISIKLVFDSDKILNFLGHNLRLESDTTNVVIISFHKTLNTFLSF